MTSYDASNREPGVVVAPFCSVSDKSALDVAVACRAAGLAFVNGVGTGWTKSDLARWLLGPYREATCQLAGTERDRAYGPVDDACIDRLLREARAHVVHWLEQSDEWVDHAWLAIREGRILQTAHANDEVGFVPVDLPRMRLADRVTSLFAVDRLARGDDYDTKLVVCHRCRHVELDEKLRVLGLCSLHEEMPVSGVWRKANVASVTEVVIPSARDRRGL
jgi:hypothetical protein